MHEPVGIVKRGNHSFAQIPGEHRAHDNIHLPHRLPEKNGQEEKKYQAQSRVPQVPSNPEGKTEPEEVSESAPDEGPGEVEAEAEDAPVPRAVVREVIEYGPDAVSASLTALLVVALVVMWFAGLGAASLVRGIVPGLLQTIYSNLLVFVGGALGVGIIAAAVTYLVVKKRSG